MPDSIVGHVAAVHGFRLKVELAPNIKSPVRSGLDGTETAITINALLTFNIGAGQDAVGVITDLEARETYEPSDSELTLELVKPRRVATVQLLGSVKTRAKVQFDPGISVLPTLDTPAQMARKEILDALFSDFPRHNRPDAVVGDAEFDIGLPVGTAVGLRGQPVFASYNDLFSRPLAIVGNTGSGKSCTVSSLLQSARRGRESKRARVFILDINGEYASAFDKQAPKEGRKPNCLYVNGREFGVPVWLMNTREVCEWLSASEQTQQPALVNLWSVAKGGEKGVGGASALQEAVVRLDHLRDVLDNNNPYKGENATRIWEAAMGYLTRSEINPTEIEGVDRLSQILEQSHLKSNGSWGGRSLGEEEAEVAELLIPIRAALSSELAPTAVFVQESADKPIFFPLSVLHDPSALLAAASLEGEDNAFRQFLRGLQLRLASRLQDVRWSSFFNYEALQIRNLREWFELLAIGKDSEPDSDVCIIDCSMLSYEVLPYTCAIIGRVLLEIRQQVSADARHNEPWVVMLEEAHNYVRPRRIDEARGTALSRETFERLAKEGRKFGLSLMVASQRPSEISATVLSQCANLIMHRLKNPDDIEHFRNIVPAQSRRLLDQVTILAAGEAIVFGSAFHVPARVQIALPARRPSSQSSAPHLSWKNDGIPKAFDLDQALKNWGLGDV